MFAPGVPIFCFLILIIFNFMPELDFSFYVMNVKDWGLKYKVIDDFFNNLRLPTVLEVGQCL